MSPQSTASSAPGPWSKTCTAEPLAELKHAEGRVWVRTTGVQSVLCSCTHVRAMRLCFASMLRVLRSWRDEPRFIEPLRKLSLVPLRKNAPGACSS